MIDDLPHTTRAAQDFGLYAILYGSEIRNPVGASVADPDADSVFSDWRQLFALLNGSRP
jgi:hypothetical protein